jgi:hypothetical protein
LSSPDAGSGESESIGSLSFRFWIGAARLAMELGRYRLFRGNCAG